MDQLTTVLDFLGFERDEYITQLHLLHDLVDDLLEYMCFHGARFALHEVGVWNK